MRYTASVPRQYRTCTTPWLYLLWLYLLWLHSRCLHSSWQPHMRFHLAQLDVPAVDPTSWRGSEAGWRAELARVQRQVLRHPRPSAYACALHVHVHVH